MPDDCGASRGSNRCAAGIERVDDSDIVQSVFRRFFIAARRGDYDIPQGEDLWNLLLVIALNKIRNAVEFEQSAKRDAPDRLHGGSAGRGDGYSIARRFSDLVFAHLCRRSDGTIAG